MVSKCDPLVNKRGVPGQYQFYFPSQKLFVVMVQNHCQFFCQNQLYSLYIDVQFFYNHSDIRYQSFHIGVFTFLTYLSDFYVVECPGWLSNSASALLLENSLRHSKHMLLTQPLFNLKNFGWIFPCLNKNVMLIHGSK